MIGQNLKVRGPVIAAALLALLIAAAVKYILQPSEIDEQGKAVEVIDSEVSEPESPSQIPWPGVSYQEVRAYYSSEWANHPASGILDHVDREDGVLLNAAQERLLISAATASAKPSVSIDMWAPQNAFVFYDPFGMPVAQMEVSFETLNIESSPGANYPDIVALAALVDDLGLPVGTHKDAEEFRRYFESTREKMRGAYQ
jgi:hypothetical protein